MAIEVLKSAHKIRHAFYHDLESLVYVLCWICTTQGGPSNTLRCFDYSKSEIRNWNGEGEDTMRTVGNSKFSVMTDEDEFKDRVASKFDPYFTPIIPCILRLRELLFSGVGTNVDLVQTLMRKNPEDKSIKLLLPFRIRIPIPFASRSSRSSSRASTPFLTSTGRFRGWVSLLLNVQTLTSDP